MLTLESCSTAPQLRRVFLGGDKYEAESIRDGLLDPFRSFFPFLKYFSIPLSKPLKLGLCLANALSSDVGGKLVSSLATGLRAREKFSCALFSWRGPLCTSCNLDIFQGHS